MIILGEGMTTIRVVVGESFLTAAAGEYNRRRRHSHSVPYDRYALVAGRHCRQRKFHVTEPTFPCCEGKTDDFTRHIHHCCSATHVASLFDVDRVELLRVARALRGLTALENLGNH